MQYKVKLDIFEGPFDLLVHLIENAKMNIYDIQVAEITAQYLAYIEEMNKHNFYVASDFIVLAAALIEIKSKMLIPRITVNDGKAEEEDPRNELVMRLLEYKKIKNVAALLAEAEGKGLRIFEKPQEDITCYTEHPDETLKMDIEHFKKAFNAFIRKKQKLEEIRRNYVRVERQRHTEEEKKEFIRSYFVRMRKDEVTFKELIESDPNKHNTVVTFSSLLEMARVNDVDVSQKKLFGEITIKDLHTKEAGDLGAK